MVRAMPTPVEVANDASLFAEAFLYVQNKEKQLVRFRHNAAQRHYLAHRTRRDLVLKARQLGFSTAIQGEMFRYETTRTATTATLSHDDESTQKLRRMKDRFYNNLPTGFRPKRHYANATVTTYPGLDSEAVIITAGNVHTGRGGTYSHIHGSEVAYWKDAESLMEGIMQGGNPSWIVLESTPNGAQGWFYNACMSAMDGDSAWSLHFYPWFSDPAYCISLRRGEDLEYTDEELEVIDLYNLSPEQIKWRRSKQLELKHHFLQAYPEDARSCFLLSGGGYFGDLTGVFSASNGVEPGDGRHYAGLDFAQTVDYTVLSVIDLVTMRQVDVLRINRLPWAEMRRQIVAKLKRWNVVTLVAERNSMGSTNIEALQSEMRAAECKTSVKAFTTSASSKAQIMGALHEALHMGDLKLLNIPDQRREMQAFTAKQTITGVWQYSAPDGEHDDFVIANALAWHGANTAPVASVTVLRQGKR